jgi:hypothetical protein
MERIRTKRGKTGMIREVEKGEERERKNGRRKEENK